MKLQQIQGYLKKLFETKQISSDMCYFEINNIITESDNWHFNTY